jgi:hypothetical protein
VDDDEVRLREDDLTLVHIASHLAGEDLLSECL